MKSYKAVRTYVHRAMPIALIGLLGVLNGCSNRNISKRDVNTNLSQTIQTIDLKGRGLEKELNVGINSHIDSERKVTDYEEIKTKVEEIYRRVTGHELSEDTDKVVDINFSLREAQKQGHYKSAAGVYESAKRESGEKKDKISIKSGLNEGGTISFVGHELGHIPFTEFAATGEEPAYAMQAAFEKEMYKKGMINDNELDIYWPGKNRNIRGNWLTSSEKHNKAKKFVMEKLDKGYDPFELYIRIIIGDMPTPQNFSNKRPFWIPSNAYEIVKRELDKGINFQEAIKVLQYEK